MMRYMIWVFYAMAIVVIGFSIFQWIMARRTRAIERERRAQNIAEERAWIAAHGTPAQRKRLAEEEATGEQPPEI
jgi:Flp pilus assembly protein TadB